MNNGLQKYFPIIRTRAEVLTEIQNQPKLSRIFHSWKTEHQEQFLDYVTGAKGVKVLYDSFFKEIMNPETTPERLERFLSLILNQEIRIRRILPTDNSRIADENALLIMDILIELKDGSLANIEVQKVGYKFPGQRCACYSANLLLRQYKRVKGQKGDTFSYKDIKRVYTLVLFEKSSREFHQYPNDYLHRIRPVSDIGIQLELLQEYLLIPLDIFRMNMQSRGIKSELDAWLTFLSADEPEIIEQLIQDYPRFAPMYHQIYEICMNTERMMEMYSEELKILDRNTVQLMIDEMQDEIAQMKEQLFQRDKQIALMSQQNERQLFEKNQEIASLKKQLAENKG